jgi:hypothetical protein
VSNKGLLILSAESEDSNTIFKPKLFAKKGFLKMDQSNHKEMKNSFFAVNGFQGLNMILVCFKNK